MTCVKFRDIQCHNDRPLVDQKHAVEYTLAFAGILNLSADTEIFDSGKLSNYEQYDVGAWSEVAGGIQGSGTSGWYPCMSKSQITGSFSTTFTASGSGGFMFSGSSSSDYYVIWWTADRVGVSEISSGSETVLVSMPSGFQSGQANVTVGVYLQSHSKIDEIDDIAVGLWFDDKLLLAFAIPYTSNSGRLGFAVKGGWTCTFSNLTVYKAHSIVPWTSVDPGETAAAGMSRVTAYTRLRLLARYDGSVRLYRAGYHQPDMSIATSRVTMLDKQYSVYWPSHLRTVGALHEADTFRSGNQGHIFALQNDPNALSSTETLEKGTRYHRGVEQSATRAMVTLPPDVTLEPGDIVELDGDEWHINAIEYNLAWDEGNGVVLRSQLKLTRAIET